MGLGVRSIASRKDTLNECGKLTIFIFNTIPNSIIRTRVVGISGGCTINVVGRVVRGSPFEVRDSYPISSGYNNYAFHSVACRGRLRDGLSFMGNGVRHVTGLPVEYRRVVNTSSVLHCQGGTRCPIYVRNGNFYTNFCTCGDREVIPTTSYLLRPTRFGTNIRTFRG